MFGLSIPSYWIAIAGAAIFGFCIWKSYDIGHSYGVSDGNLKITQIKLDLEKKYSDQITGLIAANKASSEQQQGLSEQLDRTEADLNELTSKNHEEAKNDPNANQCGVGEASTQRLNQIH